MKQRMNHINNFIPKRMASRSMFFAQPFGLRMAKPINISLKMWMSDLLFVADGITIAL